MAAIVLACFVVACSGCATPRVRQFDVGPEYLDRLRGANSLAHGSAEEPPKAALAQSAHAAALLRIRGERVELASSFWRSLIERSGEDSDWVAYYACLAGGGKSGAQLILNQSELDSSPTWAGMGNTPAPLTGNAALEELTGRLVRKCLGLPSSSTHISVSEVDSIIIRARLRHWGFGGGAEASDEEIDHVATLVRQQGCTEWNQAAVWALLQLTPSLRLEELRRCGARSDILLEDPVALYTSVELGMPSVQAEGRASNSYLRTWLTSGWTPRDSSQPSAGDGTLDNTVRLVELSRIKGWRVPTWASIGVAESSRHHARYDARLAFLCWATAATCDGPAIRHGPTQLEVARGVLDGSLTDTEGRLAGLAALADAPVQIGLCSGVEAALYDAAPQTFSTLASVDKTCWEPLGISAETLTQRISASLRNGNLDEARQLMLLAETTQGKLQVRESMLPRVRETWNQVISAISTQCRAQCLEDALPLDIVLFAATLEEWA